MYDLDDTTYRSTAFDTRERPICFLVIHYTAAHFNASVNALAKGRDVSAHYLVATPDDPTYRRAGFDQVRIFNLVDEHQRAWHAGVSAWANESGLNHSAIGIELVNHASARDGRFDFPAYPPEQVAALIQLCQNIMARYPAITPCHVLGHSDISIGRKSDPGAAFPWLQLHRAGIGAWYDEGLKTDYQARFTRQLPDHSAIFDKLRQYGYSVPAQPEAAYRQRLLRAFQLHFRPDDHQGVLDAETAAIIHALVDRYRT